MREICADVNGRFDKFSTLGCNLWGYDRFLDPWRFSDEHLRCAAVAAVVVVAAAAVVVAHPVAVG